MDKYLPLGSIISLKQNKTQIMIVGYTKNIKIDKEKKYDYVGCIYPFGIISLKEMLCFNHEDIEKVFYIGYKNDVFLKMNDIMKNIKVGE